MCVFGFVEAFNPADELGASLVINVIFTCITYPIYSLYMDRFISFTSCLVMALFWLIENLQLSEEITVSIFFFGCTFGIFDDDSPSSNKDFSPN